MKLPMPYGKFNRLITIFVDDGPRNVEVAAAMGMQTLCPQNN